jgi:Lamin Tail Domain
MRVLVVAAIALSLGCLEPPAPRRGPSSFEVMRVEAVSGELRALGRVPSLRVRFDDALAPPHEDDLLLLRGLGSDAVTGDLENLPLSSSTLARRLAVRVGVDPTDPAVLRVEGMAALPPDSDLTLLLSTRLRALRGAALDRPTRTDLRVASVARCGALGTLAVADAITARPGALPLRLDRGVRSEGAPFFLRDPLGAVVPARASLDCFDDEGYARCAWLTPLAPLVPGAHTLQLGELRARNGARCEAAPQSVEVTPGPAAPLPTFATPLPCADEERPIGGVCVQARPTELVVRAATTADAALRVRVAPDDQGDPREAVGPLGTQHAVRVRGLRPFTRYALSLWAAHGAGEAAYLPLGALETPATQGDLRITEVLARPAGSAAQEFVEVENPGPDPVSLRGWSLSTGGASAALDTDAVLAPGARAVVAGASFDLRGSPREGDPAVGVGAVVVLMRGSVAGRGLRDDGADLALRDPQGHTVSVFPGASPVRPPRAGASLVRAAWDLDDDDPHAWAYDVGGGSTPGSANRIP